MTGPSEAERPTAAQIEEFRKEHQIPDDGKLEPWAVEHNMVLAFLCSFAASAKRATVPIKVLPMLVYGQLATDEHGPVILIDSEQGEYEQVVTLWHEVLHLLGMTDEGAVERIAARLAHVCDTVLRGLSSNINVPNSAAPLSAKQDTDWLEDELVEVMRIVAPSAKEDNITHAMLVTAIRRLMEADTEKYEALLARWQKRQGGSNQVMK